MTGGANESFYIRIIQTDSMPARDAVTSAEDIMLTNSCIEGGKEKIYCLCKTKIFAVQDITRRE